MKKTGLACVLMLTLLAAFPALSTGKFLNDRVTNFAGTVSPTGSISFRVTVRTTRLKNGKKHVSRGVSRVAFSVPVSCPGGPTTVTRNFRPGVKLSRMWHMNGLPVGDNSSGVADISGTKRAGTIRVHGDLNSTPQGQDCESGVLSWSAAPQ